MLFQVDSKRSNLTKSECPNYDLNSEILLSYISESVSIFEGNKNFELRTEELTSNRTGSNDANLPDLDQGDSDKDPNWYPEEDGPNRLVRLAETVRSSTPGTSNALFKC